MDPTAHISQLGSRRRLPSGVGARLAFLAWVQENYPLLYRQAVLSLTPGYIDDELENGQLAGFNDPGDPEFTGPVQPVDIASNTPWYTTVLQSLNQGFSQYINYQDSRAIFQMNLARAAQGLPPMTQQQVSPPPGTPAPTNWQQYIVPVAIVGVILLVAAKA